MLMKDGTFKEIIAHFRLPLRRTTFLTVLTICSSITFIMCVRLTTALYITCDNSSILLFPCPPVNHPAAV